MRTLKEITASIDEQRRARIERRIAEAQEKYSQLQRELESATKTLWRRILLPLSKRDLMEEEISQCRKTLRYLQNALQTGVLNKSEEELLTFLWRWLITRRTWKCYQDHLEEPLEQEGRILAARKLLMFLPTSEEDAVTVPRLSVELNVSDIPDYQFCKVDIPVLVYRLIRDVPGAWERLGMSEAELVNYYVPPERIAVLQQRKMESEQVKVRDTMAVSCIRQHNGQEGPAHLLGDWLSVAVGPVETLTEVEQHAFYVQLCKQLLSLLREEIVYDFPVSLACSLSNHLRFNARTRDGIALFLQMLLYGKGLNLDDVGTTAEEVAGFRMEKWGVLAGKLILAPGDTIAIYDSYGRWHLPKREHIVFIGFTDNKLLLLEHKFFSKSELSGYYSGSGKGQGHVSGPLGIKLPMSFGFSESGSLDLHGKTESQRRYELEVGQKLILVAPNTTELIIHPKEITQDGRVVFVVR